MKKYYFLIFVGLGMLISTSVFSQSRIVLDNDSTKPVPVKIVNPAASGQTKTPFTIPAKDVGKLTLSGPTDASQLIVIEYVLASAAVVVKSSSVPTVGFKLCFLSPNGTCFPNGYSGTVNIVLKKDENVVFSFENNVSASILVSGYTLR